jgi:hypothetical protein
MPVSGLVTPGPGRARRCCTIQCAGEIGGGPELRDAPERIRYAGLAARESGGGGGTLAADGENVTL